MSGCRWTIQQTGLCILCALLSSACASGGGSRTAASPKTPTTPPATESSPPKTPPKATRLADRGFALDFRVWEDANHGKPKRLLVTYSWGGKSDTVEADLQGEYWHVEFPDQPAPQEKASLDLRYEFELSENDWTRIGEAQTKLLDGILNAVVAAAAKDSEAVAARNKVRAAADVEKKKADQAAADADAALTAAKKAEEAAKQAVDQARTALDATTDTAKKAQAQADLEKKQAALEAATQQRIEKEAALRDAQALQLTKAAIVDELKGPPKSSFDMTFARETKGLSDGKDAATLRRYAGSSEDGLELFLGHVGVVATDSGWKLSPDQREKLASASKEWLMTDSADETRDVTAFANKVEEKKAEQGCKLPAGDPKNLTTPQAEALLKACLNDLATQATQKKEQETAKQANAALGKSGEDLTGALDTLAVTSVGRTKSFFAARLAAATLARASKAQQREALRKTLVEGVDTALENGSRVEDGRTMVEGAAKPRRYDIATGAVFVPGLEDVIVPSVIAVCGWEGCLTPGEVSWDAANGWGRSFSLDAGIRVTTLDTQDRRQSDTVSFLVGLSWNPVSVFRLSTGLYAFENAQKGTDGRNPWNAMPYVGLTLNVLNAAEILGGIGLNNNLAPATSEVK